MVFSKRIEEKVKQGKDSISATIIVVVEAIYEIEHGRKQLKRKRNYRSLKNK